MISVTIFSHVNVIGMVTILAYVGTIAVVCLSIVYWSCLGRKRCLPYFAKTNISKYKHGFSHSSYR